MTILTCAAVRSARLSGSFQPRRDGGGRDSGRITWLASLHISGFLSRFYAALRVLLVGMSRTAWWSAYFALTKTGSSSYY